MWRELKSEELHKKVDLDFLGIVSTEELLKEEEVVVGQKEAFEALRFGLESNRNRFHIFVSGLTGTGRTKLVLRWIEKYARDKKTPEDICYVQNFKSRETPQVLFLPAGEGIKFREEIEELINELKVELPQAFESRDFEEEITKIHQDNREKKARLFDRLEEKASEIGFSLRWTKVGMMTIPIYNNKLLTEEEYQALPEEVKREIEQKRSQLDPIIAEFLREVKKIDQEAQEKIDNLRKKVGLFVVGTKIDLIKEKFPYEKVVKWLENLKEHIIKNLQTFLQPPESMPFPLNLVASDIYTDYRVNVVVDNSEIKGAPVVYESNPTYYNLFGKIEKKVQLGVYTTDFTMIKSGAIARANGGYLIINALDSLRNFGVWDALKRVLKTGKLAIEDLAEQYSLMASSTLKPEPIPVDLKVIIVGDPSLYRLLYEYDPDFKKIFNIKVEFDWELKKERETIEEFVQYVRNLQNFYKLKPFHISGLAALIEIGSRLVSHREKFSARLRYLEDLVMEADQIAEEKKKKVVDEDDVYTAFENRIKRSSLIVKKIDELIKEDTIYIDTTGAVVGQINGLAVYDLGEFSFGRPVRITARTFLGRNGIINIERESQLSGKIHNKGVLILSSFLGDRFAQDKPISLNISLTFEQSYSTIDGDSASAGELIAIMSKLSGVPVKQNLAITGSVNQKGEIQPIGGVNEKIEGFFRICKEKGLTGDQGVIIPESNVKNLVLSREVREAVERGDFHIYAVSHIDDAIELILGKSSGKPNKAGKFPRGSINYLVDKKIREYAETLTTFGKTSSTSKTKKKKEGAKSKRS